LNRRQFKVFEIKFAKKYAIPSQFVQTVNLQICSALGHYFKRFKRNSYSIISSFRETCEIEKDGIMKNEFAEQNLGGYNHLLM